MFEKMKKELSENIKKAYSKGKVSSKEIGLIVENTVAKVIEESKKSVTDINKLSKDAIFTSLKELEHYGKVEKAKIDAVVTGVINGVNKQVNEAIDKTELELLKAKYRLKEEQDKLALRVKDVLEGAKETASEFSENTKKDLEDVVVKTKMKSARMLGLMDSAFRQSVKTIIEEGKDVEAKIANIAKDVAMDAMEEGRLSAQKVRDISKDIILSAIEEAQELKKHIEETTKGVVEGVKQAIVEEIAKTEEKLVEAKNKANNFIEEDIRQTVEDLENVNEKFVEVLGDVASSVDETARKVLMISKKAAKENASQIKKSSEKAIDTAIAYLKEFGSSAAYNIKEKTLDFTEATIEEVNELSKKMLEVTKGAFNGMIEGAKKALKKDEEEKKQ